MSEFDKNIRKKKIFASSREKEFVHRKPVILAKHERDFKESDAAQTEKEKPPVIMIKARESSTSKDAENGLPSPKKAISKETEVETAISTVKIAQNENKEKKKSDPKLPAPPISMLRPAKLIDDYLDFSTAAAEYLQESNSNFLVVGIIGGQGVGKSTIMNILAHSSDLSHLCDEILNSHDTTDDYEKDDTVPLNNIENMIQTEDLQSKIQSNSPEEVKDKPFIFKCQDMKQIETGQACTLGVDMYISDNRIILLDTGPIFSAGGSRIMANSTYNSLPRGGLEISSFLLAVCHVVILVQDWFVDLNMLRFIQSAEMVKPSIPAASNLNHLSTSGLSNQDNDVNSPKDHYPHLLFLQNKCSMDDFNPAVVKQMQDVYIKSFCKSNLNIHSGIYMYDSESETSIYKRNDMFHNLNVENCGKPVNLFLIPMISEREDDKLSYKGHPTIEELGHRLRCLVFGASRNQLTNVTLNEKTWLQYSNKTWENIKKSTFFNEYNRLLP